VLIRKNTFTYFLKVKLSDFGSNVSKFLLCCYSPQSSRRMIKLAIILPVPQICVVISVGYACGLLWCSVQVQTNKTFSAASGHEQGQSKADGRIKLS
jgi:hypothetical protein